jgi:hypothetical protein
MARGLSVNSNTADNVVHGYRLRVCLDNYTNGFRSHTITSSSAPARPSPRALAPHPCLRSHRRPVHQPSRRLQQLLPTCVHAPAQLDGEVPAELKAMQVAQRGCQGQMPAVDCSRFLKCSSILTGAVMIDRMWAERINHRHTEAAPCATGRRGACGVEGHAGRSAWLSRADARSRSQRIYKAQ